MIRRLNVKSQRWRYPVDFSLFWMFCAIISISFLCVLLECSFISLVASYSFGSRVTSSVQAALVQLTLPPRHRSVRKQCRACTAQFEAWSCSSWRSPHHGPPTSLWHARAQRHQKWALASIREGLCMKCWVRSQGTANMSLTNTCMQIQKTVEEHSERWRSGFVRINQSCSTTKKGRWDLANTETKPGTGSLTTIDATQILPSQSPTPPVLCGVLHYMPRRSDKQGNEGEMVHPDVGDRVAFCEMSLIDTWRKLAGRFPQIPAAVLSRVLWAGTTIAHCFWLEWIIRLRFLWPCMAAQPQMLPRKNKLILKHRKKFHNQELIT